MVQVFNVLILVLLIFLFNNHVSCESIPRFDMRDKDGIIFEPLVPRAGQKLIAKCSVVGLTPENKKSVSWMLKRENDKKLITLAINSDVFQFQSPLKRLSSYHELNSNDWYLIFHPIDRDDIGNLTCLLADTGGRDIKLTRYLDVHSEPIILESSTKDVDVHVGENVSLTCFSQGYPKPSISWIRADSRPFQNGIVKFDESILKLTNLSKDDRGVYKCLASNLIGYGSEWTIKISVKFNPTVKCQKSVGQAPNFEVDAYMECYAYGYPPPRLSWYKELDPNNANALLQLTEKTFKYKFEATIPEPEVCTDCILARITVINVLASDYGNYVLRASSEEFKNVIAQDRVRLYETPECQQSISNPDNKGCRSPPKNF